MEQSEPEFGVPCDVVGCGPEWDVGFGAESADGEGRVVDRGEAVVASAREMAGPVLEEIKDSKLYSLEYRTFEQYVKERWGRNRNWAYKMIQAEKVTRKIKSAGGALYNNYTKVTQLPKTTTALALSKLPEDRQAAVWAEAVESGNTATAAVTKISGGITFDTVEIEAYNPPAPRVRQTVVCASVRSKSNNRRRAANSRYEQSQGCGCVISPSGPHWAWRGRRRHCEPAPFATDGQSALRQWAVG